MDILPSTETSNIPGRWNAGVGNMLSSKSSISFIPTVKHMPKPFQTSDPSAANNYACLSSFGEFAFMSHAMILSIEYGDRLAFKDLFNCWSSVYCELSFTMELVH